ARRRLEGPRPHPRHFLRRRLHPRRARRRRRERQPHPGFLLRSRPGVLKPHPQHPRGALHMSASAPYPARAWSAIRACGDAVEASFAKSGTLFTMGGEPTFIPHDPQGPEWNTAALGPTKLDYARRFARNLIETAYPGAL